MEPKPDIGFSHFSAVDMRVGTVERAESFPEALRPALKLWINFGPTIGVRKSSAQITDHYSPEQLIGRQVFAVINFPPKQIGPLMSECLILGAVGEQGDVVLLSTDFEMPNGSPIA